MGARQLLPDRLRVAMNTLRQDLRNVRLAVTAERRGAFSTRVGAAEAEGAPAHAPESPPPKRRQRPKLPDRPPSDAADTAETTVEAGATSIAYFALSDIEVEVGPDETILQAGLSAGVDLVFSCGLGGCGACMLSCTEGKVEYDDPDAICLLEEDIEDGLCLACVGRPRGRVVLDA